MARNLEVIEQAASKVAVQVNEQKSFQQIVAELKKKAGVQIYSALKIKGVTVTPKENYTRVSFLVDRPIIGMQFNPETQSWEEGENSKIVFTSTYALQGIMRQDDDLIAISNYPVLKPDSLLKMFANGELELIQEPVTAGKYVNPFSSTAKESEIVRDGYISHIVGLKLNPRAQQGLDKMYDNLFID